VSVEGSCGRTHIITLLHPGQRSSESLTRQERLVTLNVHDGVEFQEFWTGRNLRNTIRSCLVPSIGEHSPDSSSLDHAGDPGRICRDDQLVCQSVLEHTLDDSGDEWLTCQLLQRFVWEAGRTKTSRNHAQDTHHGS
jgi:hypothetical protein